MAADLCSVGERFGELVLFRPLRNHPHYGRRWLCLCDCGRYAIRFQAVNVDECAALRFAADVLDHGVNEDEDGDDNGI